MTSDHDVIIVGAGLAGGILAGVLAEGGRRVLLLERGRALADSEIPSDHLRNHRLTLYGDHTTPDPAGHPRVFIDGAGVPHLSLGKRLATFRRDRTACHRRSSPDGRNGGVGNSRTSRDAGRSGCPRTPPNSAAT